MEDLFAWLNQHQLQRLLVWVQEESTNDLAPYDDKVLLEALDFRVVHGHATGSEVRDYLAAQAERLAGLYVDSMATPPRLSQPPLSLREVAREAVVGALTKPPGGLSYEDARALLDHVSQQWVWLHATTSLLRQRQQPPSLEHIKLVFRLVRAHAEAALALPGVQ
jgi:hypothetical protein